MHFLNHCRSGQGGHPALNRSYKRTSIENALAATKSMFIERLT